MAISTRTAQDRCPVTGMPVLSRPEWTEMALDDGYRATIFLLGDRIIVGRPYGYATMKGIDEILRISEKIIEKHLDPRRPYVHIQDYTHLGGADLKARKYFSDEMKKRVRTMALVFCGQTAFGRIAAQLAKRLHGFPFEMIITRDYQQAALAAQSIVATPGPGLSLPDGAGLGMQVVADPDWTFRENDFKVRFEVIEGAVVHSVVGGYFDEEHAARLAALREQVLATLDPSRPIYYIAGFKDLRGADRKARKLIQSQFFALQDERSIGGVFVYGANAATRSAIRLARPLVGVKVHLFPDFPAALAAVEEARPRALGLTPPAADEGVVSEDWPTSLTRSHVEEVLNYISGLNWDREGTVSLIEVDTDNPFLPVFEALDLIKKDLDDLFREHRVTVEELQKTRDGLWDRVAERTAELTSANTRLREVDLQRNRQAADLSGSLDKSLKAIVDRTRSLAGRPEAGALRADLEEIRRRAQQAVRIVDSLCIEARQGGEGDLWTAKPERLPGREE